MTLLSGLQLFGHWSILALKEPHRPARRRGLTLDVGQHVTADKKGGTGAFAKHALIPDLTVSRLCVV